MKDATRKIVILGAGGSSIDIIDTINDINLASQTVRYKCEGILDDNYKALDPDYFGVKVLGPLEAACNFVECLFVNGIGSPSNFQKKQSILAKTKLPIERFETLVHPSASVSSKSKLSRGVVVFQNVTITTNTQIGSHVVILPNSLVSHDSSIGDFTCIAGGVCISGGVKIGRSCYIGTNSSIIGNVSIGDGCLIGMGSVVINNIAANSVVAGNPAKTIRMLETTD